jgi:hypothetical protein
MRSVATSLLVLGVFICGCPAEKVKPPTDEQKSDPAQSEQACMDAFVEGYNQIGLAVTGLAKAYDRAVPAAGPADPTGISLASEHSAAGQKLQAARTAFTRAAKIAPANLKQLDGLAVDLATAAEKAVLAFAAAQAFYAGENKAADQAQKLHADFNTARAGFDRAIKPFTAALVAVELERMQADVDRFAKDRGEAYWVRFVNLAARRLVETAAAMKDPKGFEPTHMAFKAAMTGLEGFCKAQAAGLSSGYQTFLSAARSFAKAAEGLAGLCAGEAPDKKALKAATDELRGAFNRMANAADALHANEG